MEGGSFDRPRLTAPRGPAAYDLPLQSAPPNPSPPLPVALAGANPCGRSQTHALDRGAPEARSCWLDWTRIIAPRRRGCHRVFSASDPSDPPSLSLSLQIADGGWFARARRREKERAAEPAPELELAADEHCSTAQHTSVGRRPVVL